MSDKSSGLDFDRQIFAQPQAPGTRPASHASAILLGLALTGALAFLVYKLVPQIARDSASTDNSSVAAVDKRLVEMEARIEKLEAARRSSASNQKEQPAVAQDTFSKPVPKTVYQISPPTRSRDHVTSPAPAGADPATAQRLSNLQRGLGAVQSDVASNHEAWQAATDRLTEMAGEVGAQGVQILQNSDEINQLLAHTEVEAIPFELRRGGDPQPVGPVSLVLKSTNPRTQRYTLCVLIQSSCVDLKDRSLHEVVQFVLVRNSTPLRVIATKVTKSEVLGYLEAPKNRAGQ
jgi:hypothetical protein